MAIYNTGSVRVRVGSAAVKGVTGNEAFSANAEAGYLFKLTGETTWYQIAAITNATNFTLSSRYANSSYQTARSAEHLATMTTATKMYSGTLSFYPVIQNAITVTASGETFTDNGGGVLSGNASPAGSGTINYDTGAWTVTLGTDLTATAEMTASYQSGDTRTGMSYQIVTDYTSRYDIPEMGLNDINFAYIYTKAVRIIDSRLSYLASYGSGANATTVAGLVATINSLQASTHELYTEDTNIHASLNTLFVEVNNLNASQNIRSFTNHGTATEVTIATVNLSTTHKFFNTATCYTTIPGFGSSQVGQFLAFRKKGTGGLDIKTQGVNTIGNVATHIYNNNASQLNAFLQLRIETATLLDYEFMIGDWSTY